MARFRTLHICVGVFIGWCAGFLSTREHTAVRIAGLLFFLVWAVGVLRLWHLDCRDFGIALTAEQEKRRLLRNAVATYGNDMEAVVGRQEHEIHLLRAQLWRLDPRALQAVATEMSRRAN